MKQRLTRQLYFAGDIVSWPRTRWLNGFPNKRHILLWFIATIVTYLAQRLTPQTVVIVSLLGVDSKLFAVQWCSVCVCVCVFVCVCIYFWVVGDWTWRWNICTVVMRLWAHWAWRMTTVVEIGVWHLRRIKSLWVGHLQGPICEYFSLALPARKRKHSSKRNEACGLYL